MYVGWQNPTEREQMMVLQGYHQHQLHGFSQANQPQMSPIPWPQTSPNPQQHQTLKLQELLQFEAQRTQENRQFGEVRYGQENDDLVPGDLGTDRLNSTTSRAFLAWRRPSRRPKHRNWFHVSTLRPSFVTVKPDQAMCQGTQGSKLSLGL